MNRFGSKDSQPYHVWCDVGGTFTDCIVLTPEGHKTCLKVLSNGLIKGRVAQWLDDFTFVDPNRTPAPDHFWEGATLRWLDRNGAILGTEQCHRSWMLDGKMCTSSSQPTSPFVRSQCLSYELDLAIEAPVLATRLILGCNPREILPAIRVRMGTTRGTNALLTRSGELCALVTTKGFADLVRIGYQERPELFSLDVRKRVPLHEEVIEVEERLDAEGNVLIALDVDSTKRQLRLLFDRGIRSIAICLIHSYCNPAHELMIESIANDIGFDCVCVSSRIAPKIKAVSRAETTLVDAYLTPIVQKYLQKVSHQFGLHDETHLRILTSAGGLVAAQAYRGKDSVLSGPAGGAVAIEAYAKALGSEKCIGLDMGGTSTDVCRIEGPVQLEHETIKAGVRMMIPTLAIHTVAAGGGSVCWFDGVQLRVGPQSAGADPGPACYGRGGPLTVTDLNLLSNRVSESHFPFPLDRTAAAQRLEEVLNAVNQSQASTHERFTAEKLRDGFRRLANEHMAAAVRSISISQGADPRDHTLVGFGGAAGQHICEIADLLGIERIIDPPEAGLLSALGMGMASVKRSYTRPLYFGFDSLPGFDWKNLLLEVRRDARIEFDQEEVDFDQLKESIEIELRYLNSDGSLLTHVSAEELLNHSPKDLQLRLTKGFLSEHLNRFGYVRDGRPIELVAIKFQFEAISEHPLAAIETVVQRHPKSSKPNQGEVYLRRELIPGDRVMGPSIIVSDGSTTVVDSHWQAEVLSDQTLSLVRRARRSDLVFHQEPGRVDPVLREVLAQRIAAIADQMGVVLEKTAISVNVKDRRDFSCAVFAKNGDLIANAPHVPVHLGAMSQTIRCMMHKFPVMHPGDCYLTNDPYQGGSHLPDVTVITPVFVASSADANGTTSSPDFFVACRAHHAEIGGISPGSMAPTSTRLGDEGVIIPPMKMVDQGNDFTSHVEHILRNAPYPSRSVAENMSDLAAQQAANQSGLFAMKELAKEYGVETVQDYLEHIQQASQRKTQTWIRSLGDSELRFSDRMDDGSIISVLLKPILSTVGQEKIRIDFTGTSGVAAGNLNANPAIVSAATMYVIRCAMTDSLPLNSGVLRCVEFVIPEGILNPGVHGSQLDWPAVAGGNVETSQRVVDCLLGALGLAAASQGTMNNFLFGDSSFGYYETIGGGTGATRNANGEHAVHSHMTNTRLTDVEVLEKRYPVRLVKFEIRSQSGGRGMNSGGDGMVRQIQCLRPLDVSLVTSRRNCQPFGLHGGEPGRAGENWHLSIEGKRTQLSSSVQLRLETGESILILTPGGGGFRQTVAHSDRV